MRTRQVTTSFVYFTAAALSGNLSGSATAFVLPTQSSTFGLHPLVSRSSRTFASNSGGGGSSGGFLDRVKGIAKNVLPKKWVQTEEERKQELARQRLKDEVRGGISEIFKDAPLPARMLGSMMGPMLSNMASSMAETMAEQQQKVDGIMDEARMYLTADPLVAQAMGEPIVVSGAPFSQSSSTSVINGQSTTRVEIGFQVVGSRAAGVATATASQDGINRLTLQVGGRLINVSLSRSTRPGRPGGLDDNIIEAEIVEKNPK